MSKLHWNKTVRFGRHAVVTESPVSMALDDFIYELRSAARRFTAPCIEITSQTDNPGEQDEMTSVEIVISGVPAGDATMD